jgi:hypothetical protein
MHSHENENTFKLTHNVIHLYIISLIFSYQRLLPKYWNICSSWGSNMINWSCARVQRLLMMALAREGWHCLTPWLSLSHRFIRARQTCRPVRWPLTSRWYGTPFEQTNFNKLCLQDWFWLHWWLSCCIYFLAAGCMVPSNSHMLLPWHSQYSIQVNDRLGCNNIHTLIIFNVPLLWLVLLNMLRIAQIPFIRSLEKRHYLNW